MKIWITVEPDKEEINSLLFKKQAEGEATSRLSSVMDHAYILMSGEHEVSLKITTMGRREYD